MAGDPFECFAQKSYDHLPRAALEKQAIELEDYANQGGLSGVQPSRPLGGSSDESAFERQVRKMQDGELRKAIWLLERARMKFHLVCSCWYASEGESDAMWRIYAQQTGVGIKTTVSRLQGAIESLQMPKLYAQGTKFTLAP
jgi:hypothetical protein